MVTERAHYVDEMESPIGTLTIVATERGVCHLRFGTVETCGAAINAWLKKNGRHSKLTRSKEKVLPIRKQLEQYFAGERRSFDLPLDLCGTAFQKKVWDTVSKIEYGKTRSYKEIAEQIGAPKAVRAVGGANNRNPIPIIIPCHRVIGSNGNMVGYGGGLEKKETLLCLEGAIEKIS